MTRQSVLILVACVALAVPGAASAQTMSFDAVVPTFTQAPSFAGCLYKETSYQTIASVAMTPSAVTLTLRVPSRLLERYYQNPACPPTRTLPQATLRVHAGPPLQQRQRPVPRSRRSAAALAECSGEHRATNRPCIRSISAPRTGRTRARGRARSPTASSSASTTASTAMVARRSTASAAITSDRIRDAHRADDHVAAGAAAGLRWRAVRSVQFGSERWHTALFVAGRHGPAGVPDRRAVRGGDRHPRNRRAAHLHRVGARCRGPHRQQGRGRADCGYAAAGDQDAASVARSQRRTAVQHRNLRRRRPTSVQLLGDCEHAGPGDRRRPIPVRRACRHAAVRQPADSRPLAG